MDAPFTDWDGIPLACDITTTARILNVSRRSIDRALKNGTMLPKPMPRLGGKTAPWHWSKKVLREYVEGGYQHFHGRQKAS